MLRSGEEPIQGYRLDKFLGRGQFGDVWQAQAPGGKLVALKFINIVGKQGLKEYRAIQKVKNIQHPHLMPIIAFWILDQEQNPLSDEVLEQIDLASQGKQVDVRMTQMGEEPSPTTLVVAMLLGEASLYDHFEKCQERGLPGIPVEELLDYMEEAAKGIDFLNRPCHDLGEGPVAIQHCDIKPHNMLLTGGAVQICDFGLARVLEDVRQTRSVAGTPAYIAPESISGRRPSATTDQYSLAITYYEMRTGDLPFQEDDRTSQMAIMQAHMKGRLDFVHSPVPEADVLRKATSVDPEKRYPTSLAMVRALRRAYEQQQRDKAQLAGTVTTGDRHTSDYSKAAGTEIISPAESPPTRPPAAPTFHGAPVDGTMVAAEMGGTLLPGSPTPKAPAKPQGLAATAQVEPALTEVHPSAKPSSASSSVPKAAFAAGMLLLILGGGIAFWYLNSGGSSTVLPGTSPGKMQTLTFEPADAMVLIDDAPVELTNGTAQVAKPRSGELHVKATHPSGQWQLDQRFSWWQLEAVNFRIELDKTSNWYVAQAWEDLSNNQFDAAVVQYRKALQLDSRAGTMPPPDWLERHGPYITHMALSQQGTWLGSVSDGSENNAFAWQLQLEQSSAIATPLPGQSEPIDAIEISPDSKWLTTGGASGKVHLWEIGQFEKGPLELKGVDQDILSLQFDSASTYLAASSYAADIVVWELQKAASQLEPKFVLQGHTESVPALAFVPGTTQLISGGWDDAVKQWKLPATGEPAPEKIVPFDFKLTGTADMNVVTVDPLGDWLAAGSTAGVLLWDLANPQDVGFPLVTRESSVEAVAFSADGHRLAAADAQGNVYSWELKPHEFPTVVTPLTSHKGEVVAVEFSPDGRWLATGGADKRILLWDLTAPSSRPTSLIGHSDKIRALKFTPDGEWLISAGDDGKIGLWRYRRWAVIDRAIRESQLAPTIEARHEPRYPLRAITWPQHVFSREETVALK